MAGVINTTSLNQKVVAVIIAGEELYGGLCHLQNRWFVAFVAISQAVMVIAHMTRREKPQKLVTAGKMGVESAY